VLLVQLDYSLYFSVDGAAETQLVEESIAPRIAVSKRIVICPSGKTEIGV
jgi:hypothetical protein